MPETFSSVDNRNRLSWNAGIYLGFCAQRRKVRVVAGQTQADSAVDDPIRNHNLAVVGEALARLHDVPDVMKRLNLGRSKTFELIMTGKLRSVKVGRRRLVSEAALVEFIQSLDAGGAA
jgi:excisionase family DNA binding protein